MPILNGSRPEPADVEGRSSTPATVRGEQPGPSKRFRPSLLVTCSNLGCSSGWLHFGRSRSVPVFEDGWTCSPACTSERVGAAVARELEGRVAGEPHRHRLPLGLLMLEQGWITPVELKAAREAQAASGGRLGDWLVSQGKVSDAQLTRALSLQWSCPVLPLGCFDPESLSPVLPRLFAEAFGALPLRIAAGKLLYLGYEARPDPVLALAIERMSGLRTESGLLQGSQFLSAHSRFTAAVFPPAEFFEAASQAALVKVLTRAIEEVRPVRARLVRVHDWLWMRLWRHPQDGPVPGRNKVQDVICTLAGQ